MPPTHDPNRPILLEALRFTLQRLQQSEELAPNDPALREIQSSILRTMANREVEPLTEDYDLVEQRKAS